MFSANRGKTRVFPSGAADHSGKKAGFLLRAAIGNLWLGISPKIKYPNTRDVGWVKRSVTHRTQGRRLRARRLRAWLLRAWLTCVP
ncbi:Uncharacterized protein dnm_062700 [Desulfonema magnum]|uniref:Uncharacterized protein n=1 Tax=Desulfonema magnum TaxID=45655 RepID=A0A975GQS7_9BACT|nr:Uncharacterized protein dnm_062700 [Desulfonema magnum]